MLHEVILGLTGVSVLLSGVNTWNTVRLMKGERARTDRYATALLHKQGQHAAAKAIDPSPPAPAAPEPARVRQIGLSAR